MIQLLRTLSFLSIFLVYSTVSAQLIKNYKEGMVHYRSGKTLEGTFIYGQQFIRYK